MVCTNQFVISNHLHVISERQKKCVIVVVLLLLLLSSCLAFAVNQKKKNQKSKTVLPEFRTYLLTYLLSLYFTMCMYAFGQALCVLRMLMLFAVVIASASICKQVNGWQTMMRRIDAMEERVVN